MTFWDDPQMVINHIRHSCVTSDDTGMCEMVIVKDEPDILQSRRRKLGSHHSDDGYDFGDYSQSFDIAVSPSLTGRTPKPTRGGDKTRKRNNEVQMETVQWKERENEISCEERNKLFPKKEVSNAGSKFQSSQTGVSLLSQLITDTTSQPHNPFIEYSKFDGEGVEASCVTKSLEIFLAILPEDKREMPLSITVSGNACVQDVIGFILYKASLQGMLPARVKSDVKAYSLYIAEEDGEVDMDFPALDDKESITKFGFTFLALVEKDAPAKPQPAPPKKQTGDIVVTVNVPQNGFSRVKVDRTDIKMKQILAKLVKKRGLKRAGREYVLEKQNESGKPVDLDATLESMGTLEFILLREGGKRPQNRSKPVDQVDTVQAEFMSFQYKSYRVLMVHRLLATTEIQLGVYGRRIDVDPLTPKSTKFWPKMKPTSLDMDYIADSEITEERVGRTSFRIHYKKGEDYKHYDFEAPPNTADEIVKKINSIINTRLSSVRTEYISIKERKLTDRTTKRH